MTTQETTDEIIAEQIQGGNAELFGVLLDRYEKKLLRYGTKFLAREEDIKDIVQDVFVSAYKNIQGYSSSLKFSSWIYRIAHNAFANELRDSKFRPFFSINFDTLVSHQIYEDPAESDREQKNMRAEIDRGLETLSPDYREILVLHYFEEMSYKDIADVLHIPIGTVSIRLRRAKQALRKKLEATRHE